MYRDVARCIGMQRDVSGCVEMYWDVSGCIEMYRERFTLSTSFENEKPTDCESNS